MPSQAHSKHFVSGSCNKQLKEESAGKGKTTVTVKKAQWLTEVSGEGEVNRQSVEDF